MAITRIRKGKEEKVSRNELRKTIMDVNNWTREEYRKNYDIFKNKLRFYENIQESRGIKVTKQSPQELLYKIARSKKLHGDEYEPSQELQQIMAVSAHSIPKGEKIAKNFESKAYKSAVGRIVNIRFQGFVDFYDKAKEIMNKISDPVLQEEALTAFATYLHRLYPRKSKDKDGGSVNGSAFEDGETYGSDVNMTKDMGSEFDITEWLQ